MHRKTKLETWLFTILIYNYAISIMPGERTTKLTQRGDVSRAHAVYERPRLFIDKNRAGDGKFSLLNFCWQSSLTQRRKILCNEVLSCSDFSGCTHAVQVVASVWRKWRESGSHFRRMTQNRVQGLFCWFDWFVYDWLHCSYIDQILIPLTYERISRYFSVQSTVPIVVLFSRNGDKKARSSHS